MNERDERMDSHFSRRDFNRLVGAAFGGVVMGSLATGCRSRSSSGGGSTIAASALLQEPHVCRGLNTCKGKGAGGGNACAGMGNCATAERHSCHGQNACKGQGGCEATAGQNACKGQGNCAVPLGAATWAKVRAAFEKQAAAAGMKVGSAP